jgi:hypothetical protein
LKPGCPPNPKEVTEGGTPFAWAEAENVKNENSRTAKTGTQYRMRG